MNIVILSGRLCRDPEIRYTQGDKATAIARYSLAVERKFKQEGQPTADFINCVAIGKNGEFAEKYLKKGMKIAIKGRIQTGNYSNKDGQRVYTTDVLVEEHEFCESKSDNHKQQQTAPSVDDFMNIPDLDDSELPFS